MMTKIEQAVERLEEQLVSDTIREGSEILLTYTQESGDASTEDVTKAKEAIAQGRKALSEAS